MITNITNIDKSPRETPPRRTPRKTPFSEQGITLQTLIITAVGVVIAIGVGLLFIALTSSSSEDLEDAGRTGQDAACAPNELLDAVYVRRGLGGPSGEGGVTSKAVGCKPYCATWEFLATPSAGGEYRPGGTGEGSPIGGPEGLGGVFSSNVGCFAPCYWQVGTEQPEVRARPRELTGSYVHQNGLIDGGDRRGGEFDQTRLFYYQDNRPPAVGVIRLGVTYKRLLETPSRNYPRSINSIVATELQATNNSDNDGKRYYYNTGGITQGWAEGMGVKLTPGTPLSPGQINGGIPTVHTPNWRSSGTDPLLWRNPPDWGRFNTNWEDEDWEVRADPESEVCEIVNTALDDKLVCSSANNSCLESNRPNSACPAGTTDPDGNLPDPGGLELCRLP